MKIARWFACVAFCVIGSVSSAQQVSNPGVQITGPITAGHSATIVDRYHMQDAGPRVQSVFSRTGAVTAQTGDYSVGQITGAAPIASPTFTGTVGLPVTGAIQCLQVDSAGHVSGTGAGCGSGSGSVTSVFTRVGAITAQTGDYSVSQVTGAAPLASPTFTGTVRAPTPATDTNDTIVPTESWLHSFIVSVMNAACSNAATRSACISLYGAANAAWFGHADWCSNVADAVSFFGANPGIINVGSDAGPSTCSGAGNLDLLNNHRLRFVSGGAYNLNRTIILGNGDELAGVGGGLGAAGATNLGAYLNWTGATSTPVVEFFDAIQSELHHITIKCNLIVGCVGIQFISDNSPPSTGNKLYQFNISGFNHGIVFGPNGTTHPTVASCNTTPSQQGCTEIDFLDIDGFELYGDCAAGTSAGFWINSYFALQESVIQRGNLQCVNRGFNFIFTAGGVTLRNINAGSVAGTAPEFINVFTGGGVGPNLYNVETEGAWTYAYHDSGCSGSGPSLQTLQGNGFINGQVLIGGCNRYLSIGNNFGASGNATVGGTSHINSLNDLNTTMWSAIESGTITVVGN